MVNSITGFGIVLLLIFVLRAVLGFRIDYKYWKNSKDKLNLKSLVDYYSKKWSGA